MVSEFPVICLPTTGFRGAIVNVFDTRKYLALGDRRDGAVRLACRCVRSWDGRIGPAPTSNGARLFKPCAAAE
jgi:hypothetical protein